MRDVMLRVGERLRGVVAPRHPRGQSLVIVAGAFIGLAVMVGLAVDGGILFASQAHLRRAVDAAAVAAATQMRVGQSPEAIQRFANQFIQMNGVDPTTVLVSLYNYNNGASGWMTTDCHHNQGQADATHPDPDPNYDLYSLCTNPQRKLIRVVASSAARFAFMPLMGIVSTTVTADAVSESASVDAVIVLDTSMSMGVDTKVSGSRKSVRSLADAAACNAIALTDPTADGTIGVGNCRPLMDAKEAAKIFVRRLYPDYDRVAIVHFDFKARGVVITDTKPATAAGFAGFGYVRQIQNADPNLNQGKGPCPNAHSECDDDPATPSVSESTGIYRALDSVLLGVDRNPWDDPNPVYNSISAATGWLGTYLGQWNPLDYTCNWMTWNSASCPGHYLGTKGTPNTDGQYSAVSTCTGCGIRVAGNLLKLSGRPSALWVIVFLSDGGANASDVPGTGEGFYDPGIKPLYYPDGYCGVLSNTVTISNPLPVLWQNFCVRPGHTLSVTTRTCGPYHDSLENCPPGVLTYTESSPPYDALDYALDMVDEVALRVNCRSDLTTSQCDAWKGAAATNPLYNSREHMISTTAPSGANLVIYSIGLGSSVKTGTAQALLRYMAAVGDDGDRVTDPCQGAGDASSCGNYYYASQGAQLSSVFEDIAKRVFTRLSK